MKLFRRKTEEKEDQDTQTPPAAEPDTTPASLDVPDDTPHPEPQDKTQKKESRRLSFQKNRSLPLS